MKKLIAQRYVIKQNLLAIIGFCLVCYFSYHALLGERSYIRLIGLNKEISQKSDIYDRVFAEKEVLRTQVVKLRPDSIDRDLLEERVQYVLGYYPKETSIILR